MKEVKEEPEQDSVKMNHFKPRVRLGPLPGPGTGGAAALLNGSIGEKPGGREIRKDPSSPAASESL